MAPFFPTSETGMIMGETMVGVVFAFYPVGTVLATPLPPLAMRALGPRATVSMGLVINGLSSLAFGFVPSLTTSPIPLGALLCGVRAMGGVGSALAEAGTFTVITTVGFGSRIGTIMSMVEVVIGLAAAGGTFAGGVLYSAGSNTPFGAFLLPFIATSACTLCLVPLVWFSLPRERLTEEDGTEGEGVGNVEPFPPQTLWSLPRLIALASTLAGSGLIEAVYPTLPPRLEAMGLDAAQIGYLLSANALAYMFGALCGGCIVDRWPTRSTRRLVMGSGWVLMAISYATFGPLAALQSSSAAQVKLVAVGMFVQGLGSGGIIVPSLPDAQDGLASELDKATVCSTWNSCYSGGAAFGPIVGASLTHAFGFNVMCIAFAAWGSISVLALVVTSPGNCVTALAKAGAPESQRGSERSVRGRPSLTRQPSS